TGINSRDRYPATPELTNRTGSTKPAAAITLSSWQCPLEPHRTRTHGGRSAHPTLATARRAVGFDRGSASWTVFVVNGKDSRLRSVAPWRCGLAVRGGTTP